MPYQPPDARRSTSLRLWPGIFIVSLQWLARFGLPIIDPDLTPYGVMAGVLGWVALLIWWLFFSRAERGERFGAVAVMGLALAATWPVLDRSLATGAQGFIFPILAVPGVSLAFVSWAVISRSLSIGLRRTAMIAAIVLSCLVWTLVRTGGFDGSFDNDLAWRWSETAEDRLLAQAETLEVPAPDAGVPAAVSPPAAIASPAPSAPAERDATSPAPINKPASPDRALEVKPAAAASEAIEPTRDWPGFRGGHRDGVVRGVRINTDWAAAPPVQLWRRAIGPGWSSFAVHGDLLFTQEQRGEDEIVSAYRVSTGAPVWRHRDAARFYESNGGPGPRGTPTFSDGRIYTFGATGILNALEASNGRLVWSRNVGSDGGITIPDWGFASSPLLVEELVIVAAAGKLVAYERGTGTPRWFGPDGGPGYSSPHLATIDGVPQILLLSGGGVTSVGTTDGAKLWEVTVTSSAMSSPIVQPAFTADGDLLLGDGTASALRRVAVTRTSSGWTVEERWKSTGLKPLFNDFVVHQGHAFGFDGTILACVDVNDGARKWKAGRYGAGQMILLEDQSVLVVVSEEGGLALVAASADKFTELARIPAIEGKTWNHPVVAGDVLLVRNGEEMAAFKLPMVSR